jgi:signal transduction histidine kinase
MPRSIRWRLPLSYAAIALLTAFSLGTVLLTTLRNYYSQRELDYLTDNAQAIGVVMADPVEEGMSLAVLQSQLESYSFLSQTRVRLLDEEQQLLADSGSPQMRREIIAFSLEEESALPLSLFGNSEVEVEIEDDADAPGSSRAVSTTLGNGSYRSFIVVEDGRTIVTETIVITGTGLESLVDSVERLEEYAVPFEFVSRMPAIGTPYGFGFNLESPSDGRRSEQVVRYPFYNGAGDLLGYVELSDGPAYGRDIVNSVARGWAVAGAVAVLLAAGVGWLASRYISVPLLALTDVTARMTQGDLSARADVARQDEFGALARSFNRMADRVEETVMALRRFVSDAAHEIHTPLTALRTNLELAPDDEAMRRAQSQIERLETLTKGLLNLSRIEAHDPAEARTPVALVQLVQEVAETYASQAEQAGLSFDLVLPATPVSVTGDQAQLRRALGNLMDNAIKFTPEGGAVRVELDIENRRAELRVEDTGIGIPEQDLPHLFSRFHRGSTAAAYPGSGLGLAIVKAIVEAHGGQVKGENVERGARFTIWLPCYA